MGYDIHITRAENASDSSVPITLDEWSAYVASDPEMRMDNFAEIEVPGGSILRMDSPGLAVWTAWSGHGNTGMAWFGYWNGRVVVKNPNDEILGKMRRIAAALQARVVGDDGETY